MAAPDETVKFQHFSDEIPQNTGTCALQDSKGFMWLGTTNGLNRYDGIKTLVYEYDIEDSTSISNSCIRKIIEDRCYGNLWIATKHGLNLYNREQDNFIRYKFNDKDRPSLSGFGINDIIEDSQGTLWIVSRCICRFNREKQDFTCLIDDVTSYRNFYYSFFMKTIKAIYGLFVSRICLCIIEKHNNLRNMKISVNSSLI